MLGVEATITSWHERQVTKDLPLPQDSIQLLYENKSLGVFF